VHYNLLNATQAPSTTDRSGVRLRLALAGARLKQLETMLLLAPVELPCPSGQTGPLCDRQKAELDLVQRFGAESAATVEGLQLLCGDGSGRPKPGPTQSCTRPVQQREVIHGIAGHMHLLGRSIRVDLNPGRRPRAPCSTSRSTTSTTRTRTGSASRWWSSPVTG
jgi:hypothetical protein